MLFSESNEVFYNKVQVFNRDLSIHVIKYFAEVRLREQAEAALRKERKAAKQPFAEEDEATLNKTNWSARAAESAKSNGIVILDALAATALRSIRYTKEIPGVRKVVANDLDAAAVEAARKNAEFNNVEEGKLDVLQGDATLLMYTRRSHEQQFDVIDLDPYGSAAPFVDGAVQAVKSGGLLCVTSTDMAVLGGANTEACFAKYGSMPTKGKYLHEMALRILLHLLDSSATKYKRHVVPVLSLSIDFYVRIFVRVFDSPSQAKAATARRGYVMQSTTCSSFFVQPMCRTAGNNLKPAVMIPEAAVCPQTGGHMKLGGPLWTAPIHDEQWVLALLARIERYKGGTPPATAPRIKSMLTTVSEELFDVPLHYNLADICSHLHCTAPPLPTFRAAVINAGYRISAQHKDPGAIKTDAPDDVIWDIMRCWVKTHPVSAKRLKPDTAAFKILSKEPKHEADFSPVQGSRLRRVSRFHQNPEPFWGPKSRATGKRKADEAPAGGEAKKGKEGGAGGNDLLVQGQGKEAGGSAAAEAPAEANAAAADGGGAAVEVDDAQAETK
eukprot:TRINITY_DN2495_c0_g1_i1.p1 TRINITY_DN2495_c0_g1~~TRINITY_DN2495_c0_g1_i1.p1  ORF type:complete len:556 (-),score=237.59 TRINITY_DN2495_c0_g1_i1:337-2004(-)